MPEQFVAKTVEVTPDLEDFYRDTFSNCTFILKGGDPRFLMCDFIECRFIPPYLDEDGKPVQAWEDLMCGCTVEVPRTMTLIKPETVETLGVPKLESPCRKNPTQACYIRERCVFECQRNAKAR